MLLETSMISSIATKKTAFEHLVEEAHARGHLLRKNRRPDGSTSATPDGIGPGYSLRPHKLAMAPVAKHFENLVDVADALERLPVNASMGAATETPESGAQHSELAHVESVRPRPRW